MSRGPEQTFLKVDIQMATQILSGQGKSLLPRVWQENRTVAKQNLRNI